MPQKIITAAALTVTPTRCMVQAGKDQQVKVFARFDQVICQPQGGLGRDIRIQLTDQKQQLASQVSRMGDIRAIRVPRPHRVSHPLLVPPLLVDPVVVAAAACDSDFVELRMKQQSSGRALPARRHTVDSNSAGIAVGISLRQGRNPGDPVRKPSILEIMPAGIMKSLRAVSRPHAVALHHDKSQVSQRLHLITDGKGLTNKRVLRPRIDVFNDRIRQCRVQERGPEDQAPDFRDPVAALCAKDLWGFPATLRQCRDIGGFQGAEQGTIGRPAQLVYRRQISPRERIDERSPVRGILQRMSAVPLCQCDQIGAIEVHPVMVDKIRILFGVSSTGLEPDLAGIFIDPLHLANDPWTQGDLVFQRSQFRVVKVKMPPAILLRGIDDFIGIFRVVAVRIAGVDKRFRALINHRPRLSSARVDGDDPKTLMPSVSLLVKDRAAVCTPLQVRHIPEIIRLDLGRNCRLRGRIAKPESVGSVRVSRLSIFMGVQGTTGPPV